MGRKPAKFEGEFIAQSGYRENMTPEKMIYAITGIPPRELIQAIRNNERGEYDHLYKKKTED